MRIPNRTKQELCDAIYQAVSSAEKPLSRLDICIKIGRKKSPHILRMIQDLEAGGWLIGEKIIDKFNREGFVYRAGRSVPDCTEVKTD